MSLVSGCLRVLCFVVIVMERARLWNGWNFVLEDFHRCYIEYCLNIHRCYIEYCLNRWFLKCLVVVKKESVG